MSLIKELQQIYQNQKPKSKGFKGKKHSEESKKKIRDKKKMPDSEIQKRLEDYQQEDKSYGLNSRLAKKWGITRQQAGAFIKKYNFAKKQA